jgi:hypothetical protein
MNIRPLRYLLSNWISTKLIELYCCRTSCSVTAVVIMGVIATVAEATIDPTVPVFSIATLGEPFLIAIQYAFSYQNGIVTTRKTAIKITNVFFILS